MENNLLDTETGTEEFLSLKPAVVKIAEVKVEPVLNKEKKHVGDKVVCFVIHPDSDPLIELSSVKYEKKGKLEVSGLWVNLDKEKKLQKGSALASFLAFKNAKNIRGLTGMTCETVLSDNNYLCLKGY